MREVASKLIWLKKAEPVKEVNKGILSEKNEKII